MIFVTVGNSKHDFHRMYYRVMNAQRAYEFKDETWVTQFRNAFSREDQLRHIDTADAVITHCGVGTLLDCWRAGHKPIVLPRLKSHCEHISDHQVQLFTALMASQRIFAMPPEPEKLYDVIQQAKAGRPWSFPTDTHLVDVVAEQIEELIG